MPRIRSLHPDFWVDEKVGSLTFGARLLFQGLWTYADDCGRLQDSPARLKVQVFPYDSPDEVSPGQIGRWLESLESLGLIIRYRGADQALIQVTHFARYQSPKNPTPSKLPSPPNPSSTTPVLPQSYPSTNPALTHGEGEGGEGSGVGKGKGVGSTPKPPHDAAAGAAAAPTPPEIPLTPDQEAVMQRATALYGQNVSPMGMPGIALEEMQELVLSGARAEDLEYAWRAAAGHAKGARMTWALPRAILRRLESEGWPTEREKTKSGPGPPTSKPFDPGFIPTSLEEVERARNKGTTQRPGPVGGDTGADRASAGGLASRTGALAGGSAP